VSTRTLPAEKKVDAQVAPSPGRRTRGKTADTAAEATPAPATKQVRRRSATGKAPDSCGRCAAPSTGLQAVKWYETGEKSGMTVPVGAACWRCGDTHVKCLEDEGDFETVARKCRGSESEHSRFERIAAALHREVERDYYPSDCSQFAAGEVEVKARFRGLSRDQFKQEFEKSIEEAELKEQDVMLATRNHIKGIALRSDDRSLDHIGTAINLRYRVGVMGRKFAMSQEEQGFEEQYERVMEFLYKPQVTGGLEEPQMKELRLCKWNRSDVVAHLGRVAEKNAAGVVPSSQEEAAKLDDEIEVADSVLSGTTRRRSFAGLRANARGKRPSSGDGNSTTPQVKRALIRADSDQQACDPDVDGQHWLKMAQVNLDSIASGVDTPYARRSLRNEVKKLKTVQAGLDEEDPDLKRVIAMYEDRLDLANKAELVSRTQELVFMAEEVHSVTFMALGLSGVTFTSVVKSSNWERNLMVASTGVISGNLSTETFFLWLLVWKSGPPKSSLALRFDDEVEDVVYNPFHATADSVDGDDVEKANLLLKMFIKHLWKKLIGLVSHSTRTFVLNSFRTCEMEILSHPPTVHDKMKKACSDCLTFVRCALYVLDPTNDEDESEYETFLNLAHKETEGVYANGYKDLKANESVKTLLANIKQTKVTHQKQFARVKELEESLGDLQVESVLKCMFLKEAMTNAKTYRTECRETCVDQLDNICADLVSQFAAEVGWASKHGGRCRVTVVA